MQTYKFRVRLIYIVFGVPHKYFILQLIRFLCDKNCDFIDFLQAPQGSGLVRSVSGKI